MRPSWAKRRWQVVMLREDVMDGDAHREADAGTERENAGIMDGSTMALGRAAEQWYGGAADSSTGIEPWRDGDVKTVVCERGSGQDEAVVDLGGWD
ncbi:hypothetical protein M0R45_016112 [Rubus argutus]|uniref:MHC class I antigen n=1 Tax=Rubus argutus TaxID=59490 RepID=A0AAW1XSZ0_RUBAR